MYEARPGELIWAARKSTSEREKEKQRRRKNGPDRSVGAIWAPESTHNKEMDFVQLHLRGPAAYLLQFRPVDIKLLLLFQLLCATLSRLAGKKCRPLVK